MPKPKAKETVVWDDDDMWSDVEVEEPSTPEPEPQLSALASKPPEAVTQPLVTVTVPEPVNLPPVVSQIVVASDSSVRGISLTKKSVDLAPELPPKAASVAPQSLVPPPLPIVVKPVTQIAPVATQGPPPLPVQPSPISKLPTQKPAGGVSSIFLRGEPAAENTDAAKKPVAQSPPKPKIRHPKLGPAFARGFPPENEA